MALAPPKLAAARGGEGAAEKVRGDFRVGDARLLQRAVTLITQGAYDQGPESSSDKIMEAGAPPTASLDGGERSLPFPPLGALLLSRR